MNWRAWVGSAVTLLVLLVFLAAVLWSYWASPVNEFPVRQKNADGTLCTGKIVFRRIDNWLVKHKKRKTSCVFYGDHCPGVTYCRPE